MAVLSTPNGITDDGGDTDLRSEAAVTAALLEVMFELELMRDSGSLTLVAGRDPRGGS